MVFDFHGMQLAPDPHNCTLFKTIFYFLWGICTLVGGRVLPGLLPPLVANTHFIQLKFYVGV